MKIFQDDLPDEEKKHSPRPGWSVAYHPPPSELETKNKESSLRRVQRQRAHGLPLSRVMERVAPVGKVEERYRVVGDKREQILSQLLSLAQNAYDEHVFKYKSELGIWAERNRYRATCKKLLSWTGIDFDALQRQEVEKRREQEEEKMKKEKEQYGKSDGGGKEKKREGLTFSVRAGKIDRDRARPTSGGDTPSRKSPSTAELQTRLGRPPPIVTKSPSPAKQKGSGKALVPLRIAHDSPSLYTSSPHNSTSSPVVSGRSRSPGREQSPSTQVGGGVTSRAKGEGVMTGESADKQVQSVTYYVLYEKNEAIFPPFCPSFREVAEKVISKQVVRKMWEKAMDDMEVKLYSRMKV
uniref:Uncharacterized protein n=1 Tax=Palpitomonas bilix TaxID=652834 RepID=A0A7S3D1E6_9EUKA|mmetsp:Transcript_18325/g.45912  ORF Transcript_18325/g.45912 Transcript_18325/m.45912 type:complete len:353 (+) Transcript_18325:156-1214(+)